jgi:hypothetical protein
MRQLPPALRTPWTIAELFALSNITFLAADVFIAHSVNSFAERAELIPLVLSLVAPLLLIAAMLLAGVVPSAGYPLLDGSTTSRQRVARGLALVVGWVSIAVGIAGMVFHLQSQFFEERTIRSLVYTAPFVAPLAYTGLGLLLVLNRMVRSDSLEWARWILFLALGGFGGNFVLSLADHAQNGFFNRMEWIPVISSALDIGFALMVMLAPANERLQNATWGVLLLQVVTGIAGFVFHLNADYTATAPRLWDRFVFGAPVFAPLLFPNLAALAAIGLWAMRSSGGREGGEGMRAES